MPSRIRSGAVSSEVSASNSGADIRRADGNESARADVPTTMGGAPCSAVMFAMTVSIESAVRTRESAPAREPVAGCLRAGGAPVVGSSSQSEAMCSAFSRCEVMGVTM